MPSLAQVSWISCEDVGLLVSSPAVSTTSSSRPAVRQAARRRPTVALVEPELVEQRVGLVRVVVGPCVPVGSGLYSGLCGSTVSVAARAEAEIDDLVDLVAIDRERQRPPEADVAEQLAPHRIGRR